jgi:hypothetical protein
MATASHLYACIYISLSFSKLDLARRDSLLLPSLPATVLKSLSLCSRPNQSLPRRLCASGGGGGEVPELVLCILGLGVGKFRPVWRLGVEDHICSARSGAFCCCFSSLAFTIVGGRARWSCTQISPSIKLWYRATSSCCLSEAHGRRFRTHFMCFQGGRTGIS